LFYNVLSTDKNEFPKLSEIDSIDQLQKYFDKVLKQDYRPVFGARVSLLLLNRAVDTVNDIIREIHHLLPFEIRKRLGAYYTSNGAGQLLYFK